jgi:hypothetical protein
MNLSRANPSRNGRLSRAVMNVDGWTVRGCWEAPVHPAAAPPVPVQVPAPAPPVQPVFDLPAQFFRPLAALPPETVKAYKAAEGGALSPRAEKKLRVDDEFFRQLDANKDGRLDKAEFSALYRVADPAASAKRDMRGLDKDKDGFLTPRDGVATWAALGGLDANNDGRISREELEKRPATFTARDFASADKSRDGFLDLTEFVLWEKTLSDRHRRP